MKSGIKTLAVWLILGVIFVVLLSSIMDNADSKMTYSELISKIDSNEVKSIEISSDGSKAIVELNDSKQAKEVNIPSLESFMNYIQEDLSTGEIDFSEKSQSFLITLLGLLTF